MRGTAGTILPPPSEVSTSTTKDREESGCTRTGAKVKRCLRSAKAHSASGDQEKGECCQGGGKGTKIANEASIKMCKPRKSSICFTEEGWGQSSTVRTLAGSIWRCPWETMNAVKDDKSIVLPFSLSSQDRDVSKTSRVPD